MTRNVFLTLLIATAVVLVALVVGPSLGVAQSAGSSVGAIDSAKKQMERGQELYMQKKYDQAAEAFAAAYAIQPYAAFLYNEAVCHQKLGHNDTALSLFRKYLAADPSAPDADKVRDRIRRLEKAIETAEADAGVSDAAPPVDVDADADADGSAPVDAAAAVDAATTVVEEVGPDMMKSLVMIESEPSSAPVSLYFRTVPSAAAFQLGKPNPGWQKVSAGLTPLHVTLQLGRYHVVMERFADFHESETDIDVAAGHIHQFKANLSQGEFMAFLRVTSPTPGARIYIDDPPPHKKPPWGRTPHEGLIGVGDHQIWIAKRGFDTSSRRFSVAHGEEREELVELVRIKKGIARFEGNAGVIEVEVDGEPIGTYNAGVPLEVELTSGHHHLEATADGRKDLSVQFEVPRGQIQSIDLIMMPTTPRGAAWTQAAVSLAFLGGGFALRMQSDNVYDELSADRDAGTLTENDDRYTKGKIYAISSTACFGASGALAVLSGYNFIKDPTPDSVLRPGKPIDYPDEDADPGPPSPSRRRLVSSAPKPRRRQASRPFVSDVSVLPAHDVNGAGLLLQGRF